MRRPWAVLALPLLAWSCAGGALRLGTSKAGEVVEAGGKADLAPGLKKARAQAVDDARRQAVRGLLDLYLAPARQAEVADILDKKILHQPRRFIKKDKVVSEGRAEAAQEVRLRALVSTQELGRALEGLGLVAPEGVKGKPRVMISIRETGPGAGRDVGRASEAMRRALVARGYAAFDFSDAMNEPHQKTGEPAEAERAAKGLKPDVLVTGQARAAAVEDPRLEGARAYRARLLLEAVTWPAQEKLAAWSQEASAIDLAPDAAAAKALENAGELACDALREALSRRFVERAEISLVVAGLGGLSEARRLLADLRGLPGVAGAALHSISGRDVRLRVFVEKLPADELAAVLRGLKGWRLSVRGVEPDFNYLELEAGEGN